MSRLLLPVALCLLGLVAASLTDATAQTEQDDTGFEREVREARKTNEGILSRQKRRSKYVYVHLSNRKFEEHAFAFKS